MSDFAIIPMEACHWEYVREIYRKGIELGLTTFTTEVPEYDIWDRGHLKACRLVAVVEGAIVGFAALSPIASAPAYKGAAEFSIYIDPDFKRMGMGKALTDEMWRICPKNGIWMLFSSIIADNEASINLHYACGFRMIGYREKPAKDINGIWRNTVLMEKRNPDMY